jgi:hypothetical protein
MSEVNQETALSMRLLYLSSSASSTSLGRFSGWLIAGFGAAITLILGKLDTASKFVAIGSLQDAIVLFIAALTVAIFEKFLASGISIFVTSFNESYQIGKEHTVTNMDIVIQEFEKATLYPTKWLMQYSFRIIKSGDLVASARFCFILTQIQGWLVLIEFGFCVSAALTIVRGMAV